MSARGAFTLVAGRAGGPLARLTIVLVMLWLTASASAAASAPHVYWGNQSPNSIGRANLDGTGVDPSLFAIAGLPFTVAADGQHVYWGLPGAIGRANLDGTGLNNFFLTGVGNHLNGLALDAQHIYWSDGFADDGTPGTIGRANLDGTDARHGLITGHDEVTGVAVEGQHVYWSNYGAGTIGIANLDGSGADNFFVPASNPAALAVNGQYIYWINDVQSTIGRANLDGTNVMPGLITGLKEPNALAADGQHVYWGNGDSNSIGRANSDGTGINQNFIVGAANQAGLAVSTAFGLTAPAPTLLFKLRLLTAGPRTVSAGKFATYRIEVGNVPLLHGQAKAAKHVEVVVSSAGKLVRRVLVPTLPSGRTQTVRVRVRVPRSAHGRLCIAATAIAVNARNVVARGCAPVAR